VKGRKLPDNLPGEFHPGAVVAPEALVAPQRPPKHWILTTLVIGYVLFALGADYFAFKSYAWPFDWTVFRWSPVLLVPRLHEMGVAPEWTDWMETPVLRGFDYFKFIFWLILPGLLCLWTMEWKSFGVKRWRAIDAKILIGLAVLGCAVMLLIPMFPSLQSLRMLPDSLTRSERITFFFNRLFWVISWLVGWEFLHRYVLLRRVSKQWPRYGWLLVPLSEGLYHLQWLATEHKVFSLPWLESWAMPGAMIIFSLILTRWSLRRQSVALASLAHFIIELELIIYQCVA
jgi:hypothetical protein